jgi:hypothetical protein
MTDIPRSMTMRSVVAPLSQAKTPERLVGVGFRCWISGYRHGDIRCWETAWNLYSRELGARSGRIALSGLSQWVRKLRNSAGREIVALSPGCASFCRDECIAISMIAAAQHKVCPALRACVFAMIESSAVEAVMEETNSFAFTLSKLDQHLAPSWITMAALCLEADCHPAPTKH